MAQPTHELYCLHANLFISHLFFFNTSNLNQIEQQNDESFAELKNFMLLTIF